MSITETPQVLVEYTISASKKARPGMFPKDPDGINRALLKAIVEWVERQEELSFEDERRTWYQGAWYIDKSDYMANTAVGIKLKFDAQEQGKPAPEYCGTAMCVAGFAVERTLKPNQRIVFQAWEDSDDPQAEFIEDHDYSLQEDAVVMEGENEIIGTVEDVAAGLLGIDMNHELFTGCNSAKDIRRCAEEIAGVPL